MAAQERRDRGQRCHICLSDAIQSNTNGGPTANTDDVDDDNDDDNHADDDDKVTLVPNICPVHDVCKRCLKGCFKMALKAEVHYPPQACCHFGISHLQAAPGAERYVKILGNDFVQRYKAKEKEYKTPHKQRTYCANLLCGVFLASTAASDSFPTVDEVRAMVPEQGMDIREVLRHFQRRLGNEGQRLFNMLRGYVSHDGPPQTAAKNVPNAEQSTICPKTATTSFARPASTASASSASSPGPVSAAAPTTWTPPPGGYDVEGYEVWRGIHRDTGRNREGYNLSGYDVNDRQRPEGPLPRLPLPAVPHFENALGEFDGLPDDFDYAGAQRAFEHEMAEEARRQAEREANRQAVMARVQEARAGAERRQPLFDGSNRGFPPGDAIGERPYGLGAAALRAGEKVRGQLRTTFAGVTPEDQPHAGPQPQRYGDTPQVLFSGMRVQTNTFGDPVLMRPQNTPADARHVQALATARRDLAQHHSAGLLRHAPDTLRASTQERRNQAGIEQGWDGGSLFGQGSVRSITLGPGVGRVGGERAPAPMYIARGSYEELDLQPREIEEDRMLWQMFGRQTE
ncbi:hypothetical protein LTS18_008012 [Coniosporium uncinatum]|uniref:Uncharacterized protein n=1 Tax=Coniosporium uncinatum TaxID=93489 RepID=A0ACC3DCM0_9PEZI|nr:hypothetical protein LTS18_008012 [Coniosporium uncinatum]